MRTSRYPKSTLPPSLRVPAASDGQPYEEEEDGSDPSADPKEADPGMEAIDPAVEAPAAIAMILDDGPSSGWE